MMMVERRDGQHGREFTMGASECQQICKRSRQKPAYNTSVTSQRRAVSLEALHGCGWIFRTGGFMVKKILVLFALILAISGCAVDLGNLRDVPTAPPPATQTSIQPTATSDLLPLPSLQPTEEPESSSATRATPNDVPAPTATVDIKDIQIDVAPQAGALESPIYIVQPGTPAKLENFLQPNAGCNWTGIAGQVFDTNDFPVTGLIVEVGGKLEGSDILRLTLTGGSPTLGSGGFEIPLTDHVVASQKELYIQIFDLEGNALSDQIFFDTYASCQENLVLINFVAIVTQFSDFIYFPVINTPK
jgi:hypothetical protein